MPVTMPGGAAAQQKNDRVSEDTGRSCVRPVFLAVPRVAKPHVSQPHVVQGSFATRSVEPGSDKAKD